MGEDLIAFLIHGADGAVGFVILEGKGKAIGVGDLDGIAGDIVDGAGDAAAEVGASGAPVGGIVVVLHAVVSHRGDYEFVLGEAAVLVVAEAADLADGVGAGLDAVDGVVGEIGGVAHPMLAPPTRDNLSVCAVRSRSLLRFQVGPVLLSRSHQI